MKSKLLSKQSLQIPIGILQLRNRTRHVLNRERVNFVHQLKNLRNVDLFNWRGFGLYSLHDLKTALKKIEAELSDGVAHHKVIGSFGTTKSAKRATLKRHFSKIDKLRVIANKYVTLKGAFEYQDVKRNKKEKARRRAEIKQLVRYLRSNYSIQKTAKLLNISYADLRDLLFREYNCNNISTLRKKIRLKKKPNKKNIAKLILVKEAYDRCHTLQKVADELGLTRERVRQLLRKGEKLGLFQYELYTEKKREKERNENRERFQRLVNSYNRQSLINEIKMLISPSKICMKLNIAKDDFNEMLKHFDIDYQEYQRLARMGKCLAEYSLIVDSLGHHPTTTELCSRHNWRAIWTRIDRYWGNIDKFRKEFGIVKPKHKMHPNTLIAFKKAAEKRRAIKKEKKEKILNLIRKEGPIGVKVIMATIGIKRPTLGGYMKAFLESEAITKIGKGNRVKYLVNSI